MSRPTTLTPATPGAAKLRAFLLEKFGSVLAAGRAMDLPERTVNRYLYDPPKSPHLSVVMAFEAIGADRAWIVPAAKRKKGARAV